VSTEQHLLDEDLAQARLTAGVVFQVELVEAVENVLVRVHVQRVDIQVITAPTPHRLSECALSVFRRSGHTWSDTAAPQMDRLQVGTHPSPKPKSPPVTLTQPQLQMTAIDGMLCYTKICAGS
jgi:hypothetical protein